jgi:hypothetical protein
MNAPAPGRCTAWIRETGERPTRHGGEAVHSPDGVSRAYTPRWSANLRMALSDLKIQVSDLAAAFGRQ